MKLRKARACHAVVMASEATIAAGGRRWLADKLEEEAREEVASFLEHGDPGVDLPLLRSRLNQLRRRGANNGGERQSGGGGDGQTDVPVLFNLETQRQISEYVAVPDMRFFLAAFELTKLFCGVGWVGQNNFRHR